MPRGQHRLSDEEGGGEVRLKHVGGVSLASRVFPEVVGFLEDTMKGVCLAMSGRSTFLVVTQVTRRRQEEAAPCAAFDVSTRLLLFVSVSLSPLDLCPPRVQAMTVSPALEGGRILAVERVIMTGLGVTGD